MDYFDIITDIADWHTVSLILQQCLENYSEYHLVINHIKEDGALFHVLDQMMYIKKEICVSIPLKGLDYESYFSALSKHQRQNIRTAYNKLCREGIEWQMEEFSNSYPIPERQFLQCQKMYENRRRVGGNQKWLMVYDPIRAILKRKANFVTRLIKDLDESLIFVLYFGEVPVAYAGGFYDKGLETYFVPRLSTNNAYLSYSAGIILVNEIVKKLIVRGAAFFNLTRGNEPYKYAMGGKEHFTYCINRNCRNLIFINH